MGSQPVTMRSWGVVGVCHDFMVGFTVHRGDMNM